MRDQLLDQLLHKVSKIEDKVTSAKSLKGAQKVIWLVATAAGGMWVKHFMDLMMK